MKHRSLRARVVAGALLWTVGLLAVAHIVSTALVVRYPHMRLIAHWALIASVAVIALVAGIAQVRRGLSPFDVLRGRLASVRDGRATRLTGDYPLEVQPLVEDLNTLLDHREQAVARAVARAGDLAHGLKTPLALLAHDAERARAAGHLEIADAIDQQIDRMRRQIDYHLAAARASASGTSAGQRTAVAPAVDALLRTLRRLHADRDLAIDVEIDPALDVRAGREDLDEILGNLLDNACKWAAGRVRISATRRDQVVVIAVDDDGPGVAPPLRDAVLQRGVRGDSAAAGSGLGLAIVVELAAVYGGSLRLDTSPFGGLRVEIHLPA